MRALALVAVAACVACATDPASDDDPDPVFTDENRAAHYQNLVALDGRIVLAGEHASYYGGWMEGSLLSGIDAITRIHQRALAA